MALPNFYPFPVHSDEQSSCVRWRKYIDKFENLLCALDVHDDAGKKALLLHYIGDEAYDIFDSFSDEQKGVGSVNAEGQANKYETLKHLFTTYFRPKQNWQPMRYTNFDRRNKREEKRLMSFTQ